MMGHCRHLPVLTAGVRQFLSAPTVLRGLALSSIMSDREKGWLTTTQARLAEAYIEDGYWRAAFV